MNLHALFSMLQSQGSTPPALVTKYFLIGTNSSYFYNPADDTFTAGPNPPETATIDSFYIPSGINSGKYLILTTTTSSFIYDPVAELFSSGPSLPGALHGSTRNFLIPSGTYAGYICVIRGRDYSDTYLYNPAAGSFITGPSFPDLMGAGLRTFNITSGPQSGNIMVIRSNGTDNTYIYECSSSTFISGPAMTITSGNTIRGGFNFETSTGRLISPAGFGSGSTIYDYATNTFTAGPSIGTDFLGLGACSFTLNSGPESGNEILIRSASGPTVGFKVYNKLTNTVGALVSSSGTEVSSSIARFGFFIDSGTYQNQFMYFSQNVRKVIDQTSLTMTQLSSSPISVLQGLKYTI